MNNIYKIISFIALGLNIVPSFLVFSGSITADLCKILMFVGTVVWFLTAPKWMNKKQEAQI
ncbi:hypothetical protein [Echinicola shivajiensis]|uniref:hypothetical protein n=1 Tax=Echinicola shivajiensis TaxID=1035916 RepID=UPI001BFC973D|nr:hypothetical protein [Echinicola shivajiensis]